MGEQNHNQRLGRKGEDLAAAYLQRRGYRILVRNVRTPYGEIDLIAQKSGQYIFVEVKTRSNARFGLPEEAITPRKWQHMVEAAEYWLAENINALPSWQIDVVAILLPANGEAEIRHYENVQFA